jgi:hypothetical protein
MTMKINRCILIIILSLWTFHIRAQTPKLIVQQGHGQAMSSVIGLKIGKARVRDAAFSNDGYLVATVMPEEGNIKVWDMQSLKLIKSYPLNFNQHNSSISFFPDSHKFLVGIDDAAITVDPTNDSIAFKQESDAVLGPDGAIRCYYVFNDQEVHFINQRTDEILHKQKIPFFLRNINFSSDSRYVAIVGASLVRVCDTKDFTKFVDIDFPNGADLRQVGFCLDNTSLASLGDGGNIEVTEIATGKQKLAITAATNKTMWTDMHISKDGRYLTLGGKKWNDTFKFCIEKWDLASKNILKFDSTDVGTDVDCFDVHENSGVLVCVSDDHAIHRFDYHTGKYLNKIPTISEKIIDIKVIGNNLYTLSDGPPNVIKKWSFDSLERFQRPIHLTVPYVDGMAISSDQKKMLFTSTTSAIDKIMYDFNEATNSLHSWMLTELNKSNQRLDNSKKDRKNTETPAEQKKPPENIFPAASIIDLAQSKTTYQTSDHFKSAYDPLFRENGDFFFYAAKDENPYSNIYYYNGKKNKLKALTDFKEFSYGHSPDHMSVNNKYNQLAYGSRMDKLYIVDLRKGKAIISIEQQGDGNNLLTNISTAYSHDGNLLATGYRESLAFKYNRDVYLVNIRKPPYYKNEDAVAIETPFPPTALLFSPDDRFLVVASSSNQTLTVFDLVENKLIKVFAIPGGISKIQISGDNKTLYVLTNDSKILLFDFLQTPARISDIITQYKFSLVSSGDDFLLSDANGYYACTRNANQLISFNINGRAYSLEQFDLFYNRPDVIFNALFGPTAYVKKLAGLFTKRVEVMNNDKSNALSGNVTIQVPQVEIINSSAIPTSTDKTSITLSFKATTSESVIKSVNIWVNDSPLLMNNRISSKKTHAYDTSLVVELSPGNNKIDVSATEAHGFESLRSSINIFSTDQPEKSNLYIVSIGTSNYLPSTGLEPLPGVDKNAELLVTEWRTLNGEEKLYENVYDLTFINKFERKDIPQVEKYLSQCSVNDVILFFVSGHGIAVGSQYYYLPYNVSMQNLNTALDYFSLEQLLGKTKARQKMLVLNTCNSGDIDTNPQDLDRLDFLQMKDQFLDIRKTCGATVFSSSRSSTYTQLEVPLIRYMMEGLRTKKADANNNNQISVNELCEYLQKSIVEHHRGENPETRFLNVSQNFRIW